METLNNVEKKKPFKKSNGKQWWQSLSPEEREKYLVDKKEKEEKIKSLEKSLEDSYNELVEKLASNIERIPKLLDSMFVITNFSFKNTVLILKQNPNATKVMGSNQWFEKGYKIKKGSEGMHIFVPTREKSFELEITPGDLMLSLKDLKTKYELWSDITEKDVVSENGKHFIRLYAQRFKIPAYKVYDIGEVEERFDENGKSLAEKFEKVETGMVVKNDIPFDALKNFVESKFHINVDFKHLSYTRGGFVKMGDDSTITLNANLEENGLCRTLLHELSHIKLGHTKEDHEKMKPESEEYNIRYAQNEIEAETLTYLLCRHLGIEAYHEDYIRGWKDHIQMGDKMFQNHFQKVTQTYMTLRSDFDEFLYVLNYKDEK